MKILSSPIFNVPLYDTKEEAKEKQGISLESSLIKTDLSLHPKDTRELSLWERIKRAVAHVFNHFNKVSVMQKIQAELREYSKEVRKNPSLALTSAQIELIEQNITKIRSKLYPKHPHFFSKRIRELKETPQPKIEPEKEQVSTPIPSRLPLVESPQEGLIYLHIPPSPRTTSLATETDTAVVSESGRTGSPPYELPPLPVYFSDEALSQIRLPISTTMTPYLPAEEKKERKEPSGSSTSLLSETLSKTGMASQLAKQDTLVRAISTVETTTHKSQGIPQKKYHNEVSIAQRQTSYGPLPEGVRLVRNQLFHPVSYIKTTPAQGGSSQQQKVTIGGNLLRQKEKIFGSFHLPSSE